MRKILLLIPLLFLLSGCGFAAMIGGGILALGAITYGLQHSQDQPYTYEFVLELDPQVTNITIVENLVWPISIDAQIEHYGMYKIKAMTSLSETETAQKLASVKGVKSVTAQ